MTVDFASFECPITSNVRCFFGYVLLRGLLLVIVRLCTVQSFYVDLPEEEPVPDVGWEIGGGFSSHRLDGG
jgi:hypothetical protein